MPYTDAQLLGAEQLLQLHADKCDEHDVNSQQTTTATEYKHPPSWHPQLVLWSHIWGQKLLLVAQ